MRCGSRAVATTYGERRCLMFGWEPPTVAVEFVPVTVAARRCAVSVRTIRRWIDAGAVNGVMPTGSGRVRQVDVVSVADYIMAGWNRPRTCERCGEEITPPGVQRASRVNRRWCATECKSAHHHEARGRSRTAA